MSGWSGQALQIGLLAGLMLAPVQGVGADNVASHDVRTTTHLGIEVVGTEAFSQQVLSCLDLLAGKSPHDLAFVQQHIGVIKQHQKSGMVAWADPPRYEMSSRTAMFSLTWCASTIAHDAYHAKLYQKYRHVHKGKLLYKLWAGFKAEARAIHYQTQVAKRLDAPEAELHYLINLKGTHSDLDGDQKLTHKDYQKRDW